MENCLLRQILLPLLALCWLIPDEAWRQIKDESKWETSVKQNHLKSNKFSFQIPLSLISELYNLTLRQEQSRSHVKIVRWSFIMHRMQYLQCSSFFSSFYTWTLKFNNFFLFPSRKSTRLYVCKDMWDMCVIEEHKNPTKMMRDMRERCEMMKFTVSKTSLKFELRKRLHKQRRRTKWRERISPYEPRTMNIKENIYQTHERTAANRRRTHNMP